jgi:hypothetical protein
MAKAKVVQAADENAAAAQEGASPAGEQTTAGVGAAAAPSTPEPTPMPAAGVKARVTLDGHGSDVFDLPAGSTEQHAVEAYKARHGLWSVPHHPAVEFLPLTEFEE